MFDNTPVIAIEEHYWDPEMAKHFPAGENKSHVSDLLTEVGDTRLRAMDEAGIRRPGTVPRCASGAEASTRDSGRIDAAGQ